MRPRLLLSLLVLVLAPLAVLGWLGLRVADDQRAAVNARFDAVVQARLDEAADRVGRVMSGRARALSTALDGAPATVAALRPWLAGQTAFAHMLVFTADGDVLFPPLTGARSEAERLFLERTRGLWAGRALAATRAAAGKDGDPPVARDGWHIWYWGGGLNLLFWRRLDDGRLVAAELDRVALLADVVAALPSTQGEAGTERTRLLDSAGRTVYQWGEGAVPPTAQPSHTRALPSPLSAWHLARYGDPPPTAAGGLGLWLGLGAAALALIGLAAWFWRASSHELRLARARVTFVNQVSHELKTPLTNIRMYAELLQDELPEDDERAQRYVAVVAAESQRLSRLIGNILTFARQARETLVLRPVPARLDDVVGDTLAGFGPALAAAGVAVQRVADAPGRVLLDPDLVGQILGNLLSNVEKYAAGAPVRIATARDGERLRVTVHDGGPGVAAAHRDAVFQPFFRPSNALTDRAQGTGIGLGLARDLARLHGGDLVLLPSETGAHFEITLRAPPAPASQEDAL